MEGNAEEKRERECVTNLYGVIIAINVKLFSFKTRILIICVMRFRRRDLNNII